MSERAKATSKAADSKSNDRFHKSQKSDSSESQSISTPIDHIMYLQRTIGNQSVQRLIKSREIQAKLKVGKPGDRYELEADRIADKVMTMHQPITGHSAQRQKEKDEELAQAKPLSETITPLVQLQPEEEKEETAQAKDLIQRQEEEAQPKVQLQEEEEEEEEEVQAKVQHQEEDKEESMQAKALLQSQTEEEEEKNPQAKSIVQNQEAEEKEEPVQPKLHSLQRQTEEEQEETQTKPLVQRQERDEEEERLQTKEIQGKTSGTPFGLETQINNTRSSGQPLSESTRAYFEPRFGQDFSQVQTHTGPSANSAASQLNAQAFTSGSDIFFGAEKYQPGTSSGKQLLAHELTHVVQQRSTTPKTTSGIFQPVSMLSANKSNPVQQQPAAPTGVAEEKPVESVEDTVPGVIELKDKGTVDPSDQIAKWLDESKRKTGKVNVHFGKLARGVIEVKKTRGGYKFKKHAIPLSHPVFARMGEVASGLKPCLVLSTKGKNILGYIGLCSGTKPPGSKDLLRKLKGTPALIGMQGFDFDKLPDIQNEVSGGKLQLGLKVPITLGGAFSGTVSLEADDKNITSFEGNATVNVKGLVDGSILELKRSAGGAITGKVAVALELPKNFSGSVDVAWDGRAVTGEGKVGYQGEKLSGEVILKLMEKSEAEKLEAAKKGPSEGGAGRAAKKTKGKKSDKVDYAVFGEGNLTFAFTDWLNGTAHVIVDSKGFVTIIGKITPQKEFELFPQKDYNKKLFKVEARASYGIPVVGNIFIFANIGMDAFAKLGPAKFYKIQVDGTYSTDPEKSKSFSIRGSLNISAAAGLQLRGEAGAGLEILSHDIKAGAGINAMAGIRGYAEATPIIGYREKAKEGEDKKGEFFIRGEIEIAAQPFLGLGGDLFVEIDAPWWSPVPDKKWTWPLGNKEWPIGGSFGIGASMDYVFGSGQAPAVEFKKVDFSADKFLTDLYSDKAKAKSGGAGEQQGKWKEKNSKAAEPPPKEAKKGDAQPGEAPELSPAKSKVKPGQTKEIKKPVNPNAKTAEGKTVKEYQKEAAEKGKKPDVKEPKKGTTKEETSAKDTARKEHDEQLQKGLAALDAVTKRYAKDGASMEEVKAGVKSVRRKFKVFKSIVVIDGEETWDYEYVADPGKQKGPPKVKKIITQPRTGTAILGKGKKGATKTQARDQLKLITKPEQVNDALVVLAKDEPDILNRYKGTADGYLKYIANKKSGDKFEWPLTYLRNRASRKIGKAGEKNWIKDIYNTTKNSKAFEVEQEDGTFETRIPDVFTTVVVADIKDVKYQSFDEQLRDSYVIAKKKDPITNIKRKVRGRPDKRNRNYEVVVRKETHSEGKTEITGPLKRYAKIRYNIDREEG